MNGNDYVEVLQNFVEHFTVEQQAQMTLHVPKEIWDSIEGHLKSIARNPSSLPDTICFRPEMKIWGLTIRRAAHEEPFRNLHLLAMQRYNQILEQRNEILEAFVAKFQCQPEDIEQIEQRTENGTTWYVRFKQE